MKKQTTANLLILALAAASWLPTAANAADEPMKPMKDGELRMMPGEAKTGDPMDGKKMMMKGCQEMKEKKEKMLAATKEQDNELTTQVAKMNAAPEDKKTDLMAAVLTRMVEERTAMHASKAKMEAEMLKHMMQHTQMGKESMAQCPMMKNMDEAPTDAQKEHQEEEK